MESENIRKARLGFSDIFFSYRKDHANARKFLSYKRKIIMRTLFANMVKPLGNDGENMGIKQGVIDCLAFPAVLDQTVLFEYT